MSDQYTFGSRTRRSFEAAASSKSGRSQALKKLASSQSPAALTSSPQSRLIGVAAIRGYARCTDVRIQATAPPILRSLANFSWRKYSRLSFQTIAKAVIITRAYKLHEA
jgi:hypothetical protein